MTATVLCATDLTHHDRGPIDLASAMARAFRGELELLHVGPPEPAAAGTDPVPEEIRPAVDELRRTLAERRERERLALEERCSEIRDAGGRCRATLRDGRPWETIVDAAVDTADTALIVVGPHARDGDALLSRIGSRLLGGTADRVVRAARHPVLVAPSEVPEPPLGEGPVVIGVDASALSEPAVRAGARLSAELGRKAVLVQVLPQATNDGGRGKRDYAAVLYAHAEADARERLGRLNEGIDGGAEVHLVPVAGTPAEGLVEAATNLRASVLVVGTHARKGAARWLLGSTAEHVLRLAEIPVLVVPPLATSGALGLGLGTPTTP